MRAQVYFHHCHTLSDARYAAAEGFEFLALAIDPSLPDFPGMTKLKEIVGWISGPRIVGQFPDGTPVAVIQDAVEFLGLDAVELGHPVTEVTLQKLNLPVIVRLPWTLATEYALHYLNQSLLIVLHSEVSFPELSIGEEASEVRNICLEYELVLSCPFNAETLKEALDLWKPYAIALRGGDEEKPGLYNYEMLQEITDILTD